MQALAETVARDLDAVFAKAPAGAATMAGPDGAVRALRADGKPARAGAIGTAAAAALVGVFIGALTSKVQPPPAAVPGQVRSPPPASEPATPQPISPEPVSPALDRSALLASPPEEAAPPRPARAVRHVRAARTPTARSQPARTHVARAADCQGGEACPRSVVMAADRRLRRAYDHAIRAGVPQPVLSDFRDRWEDLRITEADRPARLVRGYSLLERDLGAASSRQGRRRAYDQAPLW